VSCLYFGLDPTHFKSDMRVEHFPLIKIVPRLVQIALDGITHIIFTSKIGVQLFFNQCALPENVVVIAIGKITAFHLRKQGVRPDHVADIETQEGVIALLKELDLDEAHLLLPRSSRARPALGQFLVEFGIQHTICNLYDTEYYKQKVSFVGVKQMVFTSPSVVDSFFWQFAGIPDGVEMVTIGPITKNALQSHLMSCCNDSKKNQGIIL